MKTRIIALCAALALAGCASSKPAPDEAADQQEMTEPADTAGEASANEQAGGDRTADEQAAGDEANEEEAGNTPLPERETKMPDPNAPDDVAAPPENATTTDSGLAYVILEEGQGDSPTKTSTVRVHYTGWTTDGVKFDSSHDRGKPAEFPLNRVIAGWTEGVSMMKVGEKRRLWIPEDLAYQGRPGAPQGMLVFDVELLDIVKK